MTSTSTYVYTPRRYSGRRAKRRRFDFFYFVGELLITIGVVIGLFAFWQVFVTDWQVQADIEQAAKAITEKFGEAPSNISTDIRTDAPPGLGKLKQGETFAVMHVPRWDYMIIPVKEGIGTHEVLDLGAAGHYPGTQTPDELGNFALAAHRRSYGSNFRRVHELKLGDPIIVETKDAWIVYKVAKTQIISPSQNSVLFPVPNEKDKKPTERIMTMTTCHPEYGSSERFVVFSKFNHWVPRKSGIPVELAQKGK